MTENLNRFEPKWLPPPGDTILDILEEKNWTQAEFADRAGYTTKHVSQLVSGKAAISEDAALRLERVLSGNAEFWLSREARYREVIARAKGKKAPGEQGRVAQGTPASADDEVRVDEEVPGEDRTSFRMP